MEGGNVNHANYECNFSVLAVPEREDMFLMNMRVYDVVPQRIEPQSDAEPVSVVWCAVYNVSQLENSN